MPSKNMIPKGKRRQTVKHDYRVHRDARREAEAVRRAAEEDALYAPAPADAPAQPAAPESLPVPEQAPAPGPFVAEVEEEEGIRRLQAGPLAVGRRLDAFLAAALPEISRARVQLLIEKGQVRVNSRPGKASLKLEGGEAIEIDGEPQPAPLRAEPEDIPLSIVYEDRDLAVINKPAGMTVHAGAGDAEHNRGTLVNALLFHFGKGLSAEGGALRPGIVHRLDKETSGLILVAKNDSTHRRLSEMFQAHDLRKAYIALVHGTPQQLEGTIELPVGRDLVRRTRMTTRRGLDNGARPAVTHWRVMENLGNRDVPGPLGAFTLLAVEIETGRTHQIRVHLAAMGHPVVGDTLYGAPANLRHTTDGTAQPTLPRNFLHAVELDLLHPRTGKLLELEAPLPAELLTFLEQVRPNELEPPTPAPRRRSSAKGRVAKIEAK